MPIVGHITNHFFVIDCASYNEDKDTVAVTGYKEQEGYTYRTLGSLFEGNNYSTRWAKRPMDEVYIFTGNMKACVCNKLNVNFSYKPTKYLNDFSIVKHNNKEMCEICGGEISGKTYKTKYGQIYGMNIQNSNEEITVEEFINMLSIIMNENDTSYLIEDRNSVSNMLLKQNAFSPYYLDENDYLLGKLDEKEVKLVLGNSIMAINENYKKSITREKALFLMGAITKNEKDTSVNILNAKDWNSTKSEYRAVINRLVKKDVKIEAVNSNGLIEIKPKDKLTRAEAFILINRLYNAF